MHSSRLVYGSLLVSGVALLMASGCGSDESLGQFVDSTGGTSAFGTGGGFGTTGGAVSTGGGFGTGGALSTGGFNSGGALGVGGAATGGGVGVGGTAAGGSGGGGAGGTPATGGAPGTGGAGTGGNSDAGASGGAGGATDGGNTGGATTDASSTGGAGGTTTDASASGGAPNTGGAPSTGGAPNTGGATGSGGASTGGATGTGGVMDGGGCATATSTLVSQCNNESSRQGLYFDIEAITNVTITQFDTMSQTAGQAPACGARDVSIYYRAGTYLGSEATASAWTLLGSTTNFTPTCAGSCPIAPTPIPIDFCVTIPAGQKYGFYIVITGGTGSFEMNSSGAATEGNVLVQNANLRLIAGKGQTGNGAFQGTRGNNRGFQGTIHYAP